MNVTEKGNAARLTSFVLGVWLLASTFVWRQDEARETNAWIVATLVIGVSLVAYAFAPRARFLNAALAVWLFVSAFILPGPRTASFWNAIVVSVLLLAAALVPGRGTRTSTAGRAPAFGDETLRGRAESAR